MKSVPKKVRFFIVKILEGRTMKKTDLQKMSFVATGMTVAIVVFLMGGVLLKGPIEINHESDENAVACVTETELKDEVLDATEIHIGTEEQFEDKKEPMTESCEDERKVETENSNLESDSNSVERKPIYDSIDADGDGTVTAEEQMEYITPEKQKCIDAGY